MPVNNINKALDVIDVLGAIPGVGTVVGAGKILVGGLITIISSIVLLALRFNNLNRDYTNHNPLEDRAFEVVYVSFFHFLIGFAELVPFVGLAVHFGIAESKTTYNNFRLPSNFQKA